MNKRIAIIGAGWAGCAAAVTAVKQGCHVTVFEASHIPGGRARKTALEGMTLDNGQHILLGAYRRTLEMMCEVGVDTDTALVSLPLQMHYPPVPPLLHFEVPRWPAPLHLVAGLLGAKGLDREDKLALARFFTICRAIRWDIGEDRPLIRLLEQFRQSPKLYALLWRPLCLAALNTPPEQASARVFMAVLKDSIGKRRADSDMLLPATDLSALFPEPAIRYCRERGGDVRFGTTVRHIAHDGTFWTTDAAPESRFDAVVLATSPAVAWRLLAGSGVTPPAPLPSPSPIVTVYLKYPPSLTLGKPFFALLDDSERGEWGQYVFDRGQIMPQQRGLFAVIVSAAHVLADTKTATLAADTARQLARCFGNDAFLHPLWGRVITEKAATLACPPARVVPAVCQDARGLFLAGDYLHPAYPGTLESAVSGGIQAITACLEAVD